MNILIVEADLNTQALLQSHLENWDHRVLAAADGKHALRLLNETNCDVVLSNCRLPEFDGSSLSARIRTAPRISEIYIILYFLEGEELSPAAAIDGGPDDILGSPLNTGEIQMRLRAAERFLNFRRAFAEQNARLSSLAEQLGTAFSTIETDLRAASSIQLSLLPTVSEIHPSLAVDWLVMPTSFLSGDNLNYFLIQNRYLIFYHLDVAGHGIPSALLSVTLNQLLSPQPGTPMVRFDRNLEVKRLVPPVDVVMELNRRFLSQEVGYFTMIYGILDVETHEIRLCQAGHPSPLQVRADGTITPIGDGGFPVGLWPEMTYEETTAKLLPGERLVLYSDGLLGCIDPEGVAYSLSRLEQLLIDTASLPVKDVLQAIQVDLEAWTHGHTLADDISVLIIESK